MYKKMMIAVAAAAALGLAAPVFADASASPSQTMTEGGHHHRGHHRGHRWHHRSWPFAHALREVDLSDAQKKQVRGYLKASHKTIHEHMKGLRAERTAFLTAIPGSPEFGSAYNAYSSHAASAAQWRIQQIATVHTNIYNLLSGSQQSELKEELAASASDSGDANGD